MNAGLKQREVAAAIGIKASTYGNLESAPHTVVRREKAIKLVSFYRLGSVEAAELLAAWDELPLSEYSQGNREKWKEQNARRSKAKGYDKMKTSLVEVLGVFFQLVPDDQVCSCSEEFGSAVQCEICLALTRLGIDAYSTKELATLQLAGLADKLEAAPPPSGGAG